mmetsp:Transcript_20275/g.41427  ORF Transcript_20275/g.41427 Transcript_20275/m.41427 type:complete len:80 (+) Transcript_20275:891-1130(+)
MGSVITWGRCSGIPQLNKRHARTTTNFRNESITRTHTDNKRRGQATSQSNKAIRKASMVAGPMKRSALSLILTIQKGEL